MCLFVFFCMACDPDPVCRRVGAERRDDRIRNAAQVFALRCTFFGTTGRLGRSADLFLIRHFDGLFRFEVFS